MENLLLLGLSLYVVAQGAGLATKYAEKVGEGMHLPRYVVGFFVVSFISILPETFVAVMAALNGDPVFGMGALLGSNVADLTVVFTVFAFVAGKSGIRIDKSFYRKIMIYPIFLMIPIILGLDGSFSREEGIVLMLVGLIFSFSVFKRTVDTGGREHMTHRDRILNVIFLIGSMIMLLAGSHFIVSSATDFANHIKVPAILIGILIVSLGTTIPELSFGVKAVKARNYGLAMGDVLGSVLADATMVIGLVAVISPFSFMPRVAYIAGGFMIVSSIVLVILLRSNYRLRRKEGIILLALWIFYIITELVVASLP